MPRGINDEPWHRCLVVIDKHLSKSVTVYPGSRFAPLREELQELGDARLRRLHFVFAADRKLCSQALQNRLVLLVPLLFLALGKTLGTKQQETDNGANHGSWTS